MELKYVILALQPKWNIQAESLEKRLIDAGIRCGRKKPSGCACIKGDSEGSRSAMSGDNMLVITDDRALCARLAGSGVVCIGCASLEDSFFEGAVLVTDDPAGLDADTLEECFLRAKGRPVTIAMTPRLVIREIAEEDFGELHRISRQDGMRYAFPESRHLPNAEAPGFFEPERLRAYIRHVYGLYGYGLWSVFLQDGTLIGCCGLSACGEFPGSCGESGGEITAGHDSGETGSGEKPAAAGSGREGSGAGGKPVTADSGREESGSGEKSAAAGSGREETGAGEYAPTDSLELQYMLAREYQGHGYAQEMCRAVLQFASERMPDSRIWVRIHPDNRASLELADRLGFSVCGRDADGILWAGAAQNI